MSTSSLSRLGAAAALTSTALAAVGVHAQTALADKPVFASVSVPGNLALALSVEFPTAVGNAHIDASYSQASTYLGYFDPDKCYDYRLSSNSGSTPIPFDHFAPTAKATAHGCVNKWSGNFLNWATMQTIDPFRWALTGGYRVGDYTYATILEKAYASGQGGTANFPDRTASSNATVIAAATPLNWTKLVLRVQGLGVRLRFTATGSTGTNSPTTFNPGAGPWDSTQVYDLNVRARVCDNTLGSDFLEANCKPYSGSYKPEGLIQQYAKQIRFSAFGYLNDGNVKRDGGVLRARQKFVGPAQPVPGGSDTSNTLAEWNSTTGVMLVNPDAADATDTTNNFGTPISNSGVMNYLNKFGSVAGTYKTYDPVGELYYTVLRYYRNLGNVASYTTPGTSDAATKATFADGFPVITTWDDPIQYSCQKNFILGIGDVNTHADRNLPGSTGSSEPAKPAEVTADTTLNVTTFTNYVGAMAGISGLSTTSPYNGCCTYNGALMAGMAYWANSTDIRPDVDAKSTGMQTVQTYWVDVMEQQTYKSNNQYYLATKYGGAQLPSDFNPLNRSTDLPTAWWHTGDSTDVVGSQLRPDTYYPAGKPDLMVSGLNKAFVSIASRMKAYSTGVSVATPTGSSSGVASFAAQYDAASWSGDVVARTLTTDSATNTIGSTDVWRFSDKLAAQAAGSGWDTGRYMVTYNTTTNLAVPFRLATISSTQSSALDTSYRGNADAQDYLNYLRGDRSQEQNSTVSGSSKAYRTRLSLVGDIVNAKLAVVGPPSLSLSDATNPGYSAFKTAKATRPLVVVAPTNAGVVHVIDGTQTTSTAGREIFAYVPGGVYTGPTGTPAVNGVQWVGNPAFNHYYLVDGPLTSMDVDFGKTVGGSGTDWRSIVVGGMGKGGKRVYALDLTDLSNVNSETSAATKVLWEFTDADMGYLYGAPLVTKLAQYGWVVIVPAGMNNTSGKNHLYILNARTGALLQRVDTPVGTGSQLDGGSAASPSGMTALAAYYQDVTAVLAESVYAGDLRGGVWRFDLRATTGAYPAGVKIVQATDPAGTAEPITTAPVIVIQPGSNRRFIAFGTGQMLAASDINSTQVQRMYAVVDGNAGVFNTATTLPAGVSFPVVTSNLQQLTNITAPTTIDFTQQMGWYLNANGGYRIITDPAYFGGTVAFAATLPTNTNPCNPSGASILYALDLGTGYTQFTNNATYIAPGFAVTDMRFVKQDNGAITLLTGGSTDTTGVTYGSATTAVPGSTTGTTTCAPGDTQCMAAACSSSAGSQNNNCTKQGAGTGSQLLNWREVPLRNATGGTL